MEPNVQTLNRLARMRRIAANTPLVEPAAPLSFTLNAGTHVPWSVGLDGWLYGASATTGGGALWRSGDALVTKETGPSFGTDRIDSIQQTTDGYLVTTSDPDSDVGGIWFSEEFDGPYEKIQPTRRIPAAVGSSRPAIGPNGHSVVFLGEYGSGDAPRDLWLTDDGGRTVRKVMTLPVNQAGTNVHWHAAVYDEELDIGLASAGDGPNTWMGFTRGWPGRLGDTWEVLEAGGNNAYRQPTVLANLRHRIASSPDSGSGTGGVNSIDPVTLASLLGDGIALPNADIPSQQFGISPYVQDGDCVCYIAVPPKNEAGKTFYVPGTGDGGLSWHVLHEFPYTEGGVRKVGIVGPDRNGKVYLYNHQGGGQGIEVADAVRWVPTVE